MYIVRVNVYILLIMCTEYTNSITQYINIIIYRHSYSLDMMHL